MIEAYQAYSFLFWPLMGGFAALSAVLLRRDLLRCVAVVAGGQWAIDAWAWANPNWESQPSFVYLLIYLASAILLTIRPSGKTCSIMAGVMMAGVAFSLIHIGFYWTKATDLLYWQSNLVLGWLTFIVLAGGATGETGRRICHSIWIGVAGLVNPSRGRGLAR